LGEGFRKSETLIRIVLLLAGAAIIAISAFLIYYGLTQWLDFQRGNYLLYGVLMLILVVYVFLAFPRASKVKAMSKTVSVLRCNACGSVRIREFTKGDYVFKKLGKCNKCDYGELVIEEIFEAPLKKEKKKKTKA